MFDGMPRFERNIYSVWKAERENVLVRDEWLFAVLVEGLGVVAQLKESRERGWGAN